MKTITIESLVLAHRHLYYSGCAIIGDYEYDKLETAARALLPESSLVHGVGGESNSASIQSLAQDLKSGKWMLENLIWCVKQK